MPWTWKTVFSQLRLTSTSIWGDLRWDVFLKETCGTLISYFNVIYTSVTDHNMTSLILLYFAFSAHNRLKKIKPRFPQTQFHVHPTTIVFGWLGQLDRPVTWIWMRKRLCRHVNDGFTFRRGQHNYIDIWSNVTKSREMGDRIDWIDSFTKIIHVTGAVTGSNQPKRRLVGEPNKEITLAGRMNQYWLYRVPVFWLS